MTYTTLPAGPGEMTLTVRFAGGWTMHVTLPDDTPSPVVEAILDHIAHNLTQYYS